MFLLKNRNDQKLSEKNFHATLCHLKQFLKNIHPMTLASFLLADENISSDHTEERPQNDRLYALRISINEEERRRDITPAHSITVQSVTASVGE